MTDRKFIADLIVARLDPLIRDLESEFHTPDRISSCRVTELLPEQLAQDIAGEQG